MAAAQVLVMPTTMFLETLASAELSTVTGGIDAGAIGGQIGGLIDSFTGGKGEGAKKGGQIGSLVQSFLGGGGSSGGGGASGGGGGE